MSDLFRSEAVRYATRRLAGEVVIASAPSTRFLISVLCAVVAAGTTFASLATYARKETVVGWLTTEEGLIRLLARQGGVVSDILVSEGDTVAAGQPIATVRLSQELASGNSFERLEAGLTTQVGASESSASARRAALMSEAEELRNRRTALRQEIIETKRRISLQNRLVELARTDVERAERISAQGFLPRRELDAKHAQLISAELQASNLESAAMTYERQVDEVAARLARIPLDLDQLEAETQAGRALLEQQRTQNQSQAEYRIVATVAGKVAALPVAEGQTIQTGGAVAVVTPLGADLVAELYAPSRASGFIREGQDVRLMYQAFPHQKFGTSRGQVTSVSQTVLAPAEISIPGFDVREPVFRIRVSLPTEVLSAYRADIPLQPGMLLTADVVVDKRSLLEWLLDPLYAVGRR